MNGERSLMEMFRVDDKVIDGVVWTRLHDRWACEIPSIGVVEITDSDDTVGHKEGSKLIIKMCSEISERLPKDGEPQIFESFGLLTDEYFSENGKFRFALAKAKRLVKEAIGGRTGADLVGVKEGDFIATHSPYGRCPSKYEVKKVTKRGIIHTKHGRFNPDGTEHHGMLHPQTAEPWNQDHEDMMQRKSISFALERLSDDTRRLDGDWLVYMKKVLTELEHVIKDMKNP